MSLRAKLAALTGAREALVDLGNDFIERSRALAADPYLTDEERPLRIEGLRAEYSREYDSKQAAARRAAEELQAATQKALDLHNKPSAEASATVRHYLSQGVGIGEILQRARELGDLELVVAARAEAKFLPMAQRKPGDTGWEEDEELTYALDEALAGLVPGSERDVLPEAVKLSRAPLVEDAGEFAAAVVTGKGNVPHARIKLAYAMNGDEGDAGDSGGGD